MNKSKRCLPTFLVSLNDIQIINQKCVLNGCDKTKVVLCQLFSRTAGSGFDLANADRFFEETTLFRHRPTFEHQDGGQDQKELLRQVHRHGFSQRAAPPPQCEKTRGIFLIFVQFCHIFFGIYKLRFI